MSPLQAVSDKLMAGFVECLDNEDAEEGTEKDGETIFTYQLLNLSHSDLLIYTLNTNFQT